MLKYCNIVNESTGLVNIGTGTNIEYYKSIGMVERDVEQSDVDGAWYLIEKCPHKPEAQKLAEAKDAKYKEANDKAKLFLESEAVFHYNENNSVETTDGNIGKLTAYAVGLEKGLMQEVYWTSKEDNVLTLDLQGVLTILTGIGAVQGSVWTVQFINYKSLIESATTVEEVEAIDIIYTDEINLSELE